jgi:hypothetical protein
MAFRDVAEGNWVVFGNDRVLGHGKTPEEAVTAADAETEFAYHRYLLRWPQELPQAYIPVGGEREKPRVFDVRRATKSAPTLNGRRVEALALAGATPTFVVPAKEAAVLRLELAEAPYDARIVESDDPKAGVRYARAAMAWLDPPASDAKAAGAKRSLVLVVYERPKIPVLDDPLPTLPGTEPPAMK